MPTREQLLETCRKRRTKEEKVDGLGTVHIGIMSGSERDEYDRLVVAELDAAEAEKRPMRACLVQAMIVCRTMCDENGVRLFSDRDAEEIQHWQAPILKALHGVAVDVNGLPKASTDKIEKN